VHQQVKGMFVMVTFFADGLKLRAKFLERE